jgi:hypothetical protein
LPARAKYDLKHKNQQAAAGGAHTRLHPYSDNSHGGTFGGVRAAPTVPAPNIQVSSFKTAFLAELASTMYPDKRRQKA